MMKKKGFTLIELLAVIVILAIIALIATPLVLKYIEKSRKESKVDSAYSFVRNLETEIANYSIKNNGKKYNGQPTDKGYYELSSFKDSEIDTTVKGDKPDNIKVCLSSLGQVDKAMFEYGKYYVSYDGKRGSISDKDTYDSFSCSGDVASGGTSAEILFDGDVNFSEDMGYYGMIDKCLDVEKFTSGEYYDLVLTDKSGNTYTHRLLAQHRAFEVNSVDEPMGLALSSPKIPIHYVFVKSENMCYLNNDFDADNNPLYSGEYKMEVKATKQVANPNYVFRISKYYRDNDYSHVSFYSSDLKFGDKVVIELENNGDIQILSGVVGEDISEEKKPIYDKQLFKYFSDSADFTKYVTANVKISINDKLVHEIKKEEFLSVNNPGQDYVGVGCVWATYYYAGNDDIDSVYDC